MSAVHRQSRRIELCSLCGNPVKVSPRFAGRNPLCPKCREIDRIQASNDQHEAEDFEEMNRWREHERECAMGVDPDAHYVPPPPGTPLPSIVRPFDLPEPVVTITSTGVKLPSWRSHIQTPSSDK